MHPLRQPLDAAFADDIVGLVIYGPHAVLLSSRTWFRRLSRSQAERTRREDRHLQSSTSYGTTSISVSDGRVSTAVPLVAGIVLLLLEIFENVVQHLEPLRP